MKCWSLQINLKKTQELIVDKLRYKTLKKNTIHLMETALDLEHILRFISNLVFKKLSKKKITTIENIMYKTWKQIFLLWQVLDHYLLLGTLFSFVRVKIPHNWEVLKKKKVIHMRIMKIRLITCATPLSAILNTSEKY